jgi:hypothetical protein
MVLWAKYLKDMPNIPVDLVMDVIVAYNHWGRKLYDEGVMLDTGRINVRFETSHFKDGIRHDGPKTSGRLIGLGARSINGPSVEEALEVSGIDRTRYIIEARKCNGWCRSAPDTPLYLFDPRNEIYV